jgi:hypothetical protein
MLVISRIRDPAQILQFIPRFARFNGVNSQLDCQIQRVRFPCYINGRGGVYDNDIPFGPFFSIQYFLDYCSIFFRGSSFEII